MPTKPTLNDCWPPSRALILGEDGERFEAYPVASETFHPPLAAAEAAYLGPTISRPIHERDGDAADALEALTALLRRHHQ